MIKKIISLTVLSLFSISNLYGVCANNIEGNIDSRLEGFHIVIEEKISNYTLTTDDNGKIIEMNSILDANVTLPSNIESGFNVTIVKKGDGNITILKGINNTVVNTNGQILLTNKWAVANIYGSSDNRAIISGNIEYIQKDCKDILDNKIGVTDGIYWIDPDGIGGDKPFKAYCDMTRDGGGWTLVVGIDNTNEDHKTNIEISSQNLVTINGKGKFSDSVINNIVTTDGYMRLEYGNNSLVNEFWQVGSDTGYAKEFNANNGCNTYANKGWMTYLELLNNPTTPTVTYTNCDASGDSGGGLNQSPTYLIYFIRGGYGMYHGDYDKNGRLWARRR